MKNKKNRSKKNKDSSEDYAEIRGKGNRKNKRRSRRHTEKRFLDGVARGDIDPFLYQDFIEDE